jgi:hypothetical protein
MLTPRATKMSRVPYAAHRAVTVKQLFIKPVPAMR